MRFDDGAADEKSHAGPKGLGGKEGIEDLVRLLWRQPHAGIRDGHHNFLVSRSMRLDGKLARAVHVLHRVDAVDHEVHQHLLQLHRISHDLGKVFRQLGSERDRIGHCRAAQENDHLSNDLVYIYELPLRSTLLEEQAGVADDIRCTGSVRDYPRGCFARLFDLWGAGGEQAQAGPGVYDCSRDRLLHFVRQGSSQLAHHGPPADVCEICLRLTQALFRLPALGDVRWAAHELYKIPGCAQNRTADGVDIFDRSVRKEDSELHLRFRLFSCRAIEYPWKHASIRRTNRLQPCFKNRRAPSSIADTN